MKDTLFILLQKILPQHLLSRLVGYVAESKTVWLKNTVIKAFAKKYKINMAEALEENPTAYPSFNHFFTRALKEDARQIDSAADAIVSPADGAFSQLGDIKHGRIFQAKGRGYGLSTLLGGDFELSQQFENGSFATIYLSPRDYHRVHMPCEGKLLKTIYIPGDLYSVNQTTAENIDQLFARNERLVAIFETPHGPMAMILVGAMIVAGIETVWDGQVAPVPKTPQHKHFASAAENVELEKGDEMGRFKLGSTVILLFGKDAISWQQEFTAGTTVQLGQRIATQNSAQ